MRIFDLENNMDNKAHLDLDVNEKTLYNWLRVYKQENNIKTESNSPVTVTSRNTVKETLEAENKRLRAENKILKQERDIFL